MPRTHPIVIIASIAVLLFSLLGSAALLGWLPSAGSKMNESGPLSQLLTPPVRPTADSRSRAATVEKSRPAPVVPVAQAAPARSTCTSCGRVESVRAVEVKGQASGIGAVAGGVGGALLGSQLGRGDGRSVMTVAGGVGGAIAGNEIEKHTKRKTSYRVSVRMDDGSLRTIEAGAGFAVGERVRVKGSALEHV
jgi:outer membrane lipoprotein SlyB